MSGQKYINKEQSKLLASSLANPQALPLPLPPPPPAHSVWGAQPPPKQHAAPAHQGWGAPPKPAHQGWGGPASSNPGTLLDHFAKGAPPAGSPKPVHQMKQLPPQTKSPLFMSVAASVAKDKQATAKANAALWPAVKQAQAAQVQQQWGMPAAHAASSQQWQQAAAKLKEAVPAEKGPANALSQDKKEKFNSGVNIISVGVVGLVAGGGLGFVPAAILAAGIFTVKLCLDRSKSHKSGGATTLKRSYKSLSLNVFKSKSISSKKKHIAERVFNTLLKEADLKYPGVIRFSKKIDPDLYNLEVNKLSKILTKNDIINLATNIFGTEIIQRIMKLVNSGENIGLNLTKRLTRSENMNSIQNRPIYINNTNEIGKNMYKENNYYPPASIAF